MAVEKSRSQKIMTNSLMGLAMEAVNLISGVILPRLIIGAYGSSVNGLISSITQFLAFFTILDSGIGGVAKASLYKPLADHDSCNVIRVVKATSNFFNKVAIASGIYIALMAIAYPYIASETFDHLFVSAMILILGIQTVAQYVFGFPYQLVLQADQKEYIHNIIRIISIILNLIFSAVLIFLGSSVLLMKLVSGLIFVIRPIAIHFYVIKKYSIDKNVEQNSDALSQKWHGIGYSIASFIHKRTDVFVLTFLSTFENISIYSVHVLVLNGIDSLIGNLTNSIQPAFGNMIARNETENLKNRFWVSVLLSNILVTIIYAVTLIQISPFIVLYIGSASDANYYQPLFATLITIAEMIFCLRRPYQAVIIAAGHYKQTTAGAYIEAAINLIISLALIKPLGLVGIAIGTVSSMTFRIINYAVHLRDNLVFLSLYEFFKRGLITSINILFIIGFSKIINISATSWASWILGSLIYVGFASLSAIIINYIFYKTTMMELISIFKNLFKHKKK
jgi:O-antigen/teichoic acid export membrane protein